MCDKLKAIWRRLRGKPKEKLTRPYHQLPGLDDFKMDYVNDTIPNHWDLDVEAEDYWINTKQEFMIRGYMTFAITDPRAQALSSYTVMVGYSPPFNWDLFAANLRVLNVTRLAECYAD